MLSGYRDVVYYWRNAWTEFEEFIVLVQFYDSKKYGILNDGHLVKMLEATSEKDAIEQYSDYTGCHEIA